MLGRTLQEKFRENELITPTSRQCDICNYGQLREIFELSKPELVFHCAAATNVDACETEKDKAYLVNAEGSMNVAKLCSEYRSRLVAFSTDYVFDGELNRPYSEFDVANGGRTVYGQTKFAAEQLIREYCPQAIIARISWLYGKGGPSFVHTMLKLSAMGKDSLSVVSDQIGNPTSTSAVVDALKDLLKTDYRGIVHLTAEGEASWYDFAKEIFAIKGINQKVVPCSTDEFPRPAPRPKNSRLEKRVLQLLGLNPMPDWKTQLKDFLSLEEI